LEASDTEFIAKILHQWEGATVKAHKMEHIWERTPFPLEL
jgi:hypothetical protein